VNQGFPKGVGARPEGLEGSARELEQRSTKKQAERWARALLPHVSTQLPPPVPPEGWRTSDGGLTPKVPVADAPLGLAADLGGEGDQAPGRIVVSVKSSDLGELSLVLDRSEAGLRVVIGIEDSASQNAMQPERDALVRQLQLSGLRVDSVQIVKQSEVGTLLAPPRANIGRARVSDGSTATPREAEAKGRRRASRKLDVIG
jgi:hypothetical protein